jgi:DNA helicase-2/ATP-dependent DNA helicase PcrA
MDPMDLLAGLNPAQREAVTYTGGPLLIVAGPGSGKTRVITHRIAYLVAVQGVRPWRIMAVTFTNKAAREMRERVSALLGEAAGDLTLGTFHAVCSRILRVDGAQIGIERGFNIYDDDDQMTLMKRVLTDLNVDTKKFAPRAILSTISRAKSELVTATEYARAAEDYFQEVVARAYEAYQTELRRNNALDFDDLLMRTVELFQSVQSVRERYQERYLHTLIDEFQDTNVVQYALAKLMAGVHKNICVVGDEDQSIYSWRSADYRNILNFNNDFEHAKVILLEQNYRSTQTILDSAQGVIRKNETRHEKTLWTENDAGVPVTLYEAQDDEEEARFVAKEIAAAVRGGERAPGDFAVMYRINAQSRPLEEAFMRAGLPYRLVGGTRFYQRREVKDILAYLRLIQNPVDEVSLLRVLNVPARGIGAKTVEELRRWAGAARLSIWEALVALGDGTVLPKGAPAFRGAAMNALLRFRDLIADLREEAPGLTPPQLINAVAQRTKYERYLLDGFEDGEDRWANVQELVNAAAEYDALEPREALTALLENVALVSDVDELEDQSVATTLITLHAAKGLEFPVVFMAGMEEAVLPHIRSYDSPEQMEEERRLCYVGMTRARERLVLTYARRRAQHGMPVYNPPSRFLSDLPAHLTEGRVSSDDDFYDRPTRLRAAAASIQVPPRRGAGAMGRAAAGLPAPGRVRVSTGEVAAAITSGEREFSPGDRVRHPKFGEGIVVGQQDRGGDQEVTVHFKGESGVKRLMVSYARLERLA